MVPTSSTNAIQILVVADSRAVRDNAQALLDHRAYEIRVAENGFDALCKLVVRPPDIVFMDITMPELDGLQSCALISANPQYAHIPVVLMSARIGPLEKARAQLAGAKRLIDKPLRKQDLLEVMGALLSTKEAGDGEAPTRC